MSIERKLSRRDFLKTGAVTLGGVVVAATEKWLPRVSAQETRPLKEQVLFSPPKIYVTPEEAESIAGLNGDSSQPLIAEEVRLIDVDGQLQIDNLELTPGSELATQVDHALQFVNDYAADALGPGESIDQVCGINVAFKNTGEPIDQVALIIDLRRDVAVSPADSEQPTIIKAGTKLSYYDGKLNYPHKSDRVPNSSIDLFVADQAFIDSVNTTIAEVGFDQKYTFTNYQVGDWVLAETAPGLNGERRIVQLITQDALFNFDVPVLVGSSSLNLRNAPSLQATIAISEAPLHNEPLVRPSDLTNLKAEQLSAIGLTPQIVQENIDNPNFDIVAEKNIHWTLINYQGQGTYYWAGYTASGNALTPQIELIGAPTPQPVEFRRAGLEAFDFATAQASYGEYLDKATVDQLLKEAGGLNIHTLPLEWSPGNPVLPDFKQYAPLNPQYNHHKEYSNNDTHICIASGYFVGIIPLISVNNYAAVFAYVDRTKHAVSFIGAPMIDRDERSFLMAVEVDGPVQNAIKQSADTPLAEGFNFYNYTDLKTTGAVFNQVIRRLIPGQQVLTQQAVGGDFTTEMMITDAVERLMAGQPFTGVQSLDLDRPMSMLVYKKPSGQA